jgi:hypothetical protein
MFWWPDISTRPSLHSSSLHLRTLHILTTVRFTSLHFTSLQFRMISPTPSLHLIAFLTLFPKWLDLQKKFPKASSGSWFQSWMTPFRKEYYPIFLLLVFLSCSTLLRSIAYSLPSPFSRVRFEESTYANYFPALSQGFPSGPLLCENKYTSWCIDRRREFRMG